MRRALILSIFLLALGLSTAPALADTFTFTVSGTPGFSGGLPVSANPGPSPSPVPEPSALLLMGSGLLAFGGLMHRRLRR